MTEDETPATPTRQLAAIMFTDVVGYTALMGQDEQKAIRLLEQHREALKAIVPQFRGRLLEEVGDGTLSSFQSAVDAVSCAREIQKIAQDDPDLRVRIGIHIGDVVFSGSKVFGDGVNVASRIHSLAEPGGICVSEPVYDAIRNQPESGATFLGAQNLKNVNRPVRVYALGAIEAGGAKRNTPYLGRPVKVRGFSRKLAIASVAAIVLALIGTYALNRGTLARRLSPVEHALPIPDKPSIAILPFANISGDPAQEYFSEGITQDLITDLSKLSGLFVIAHDSVGSFKGKAIDSAAVGRQLGVRYLLEGSVRKVSGRVRITARLLEAPSGHNLWTDRYDRELKEIFALQDEITSEIVTHLRVEVQAAELARVKRVPTANMTAYDYYLRGLNDMLQSNQEANAHARKMFQSAIDLDPDYAAAHALLGLTFMSAWNFQWDHDSAFIDKALELGRKAVALDEADVHGHALLAWVYLWKKQFDLALAESQRAVAIDPNDADANIWLASILEFSGKPAQAIEQTEKAMRLNPRYPYYYLQRLGVAYAMSGRYEESVATEREGVLRNPDFLPFHLVLADDYVQLGRMEEARAEAREILRISPKFSVDNFARTSPLRDSTEAERQAAALRTAGLK